MSYDVAVLREHFPSLRSGIAHFDGPGGTQSPRQVGEAIAGTLTGPLSNRGHAVASESNAEQAIAMFRQAYADLLGVDKDGIVYGRSATQMTYDMSRALARRWRPGDEVVVTRLDHDCNVRPWIQAAGAAGALVRWIDFDPETSEIDMARAVVLPGPSGGHGPRGLERAARAGIGATRRSVLRAVAMGRGRSGRLERLSGSIALLGVARSGNPPILRDLGHGQTGVAAHQQPSGWRSGVWRYHALPSARRAARAPDREFAFGRCSRARN